MDKKGFTLIEVVVTLALVGVVGLFIVSFIPPVFTISDGIYNKTEAISMINTIYNQAVEDLRELSSVVSIENSNITLKYKTPQTLPTENEELNGTELAQKIFPGRNISVQFGLSLNPDINIIYVYITIYDDNGNEITSTTKTVVPPNYIK